MSEHRQDDSPIRDWLGVLSRGRWIVVAAVVATTVTAFAVSRSQQHLYQATATVLVNEQSPAVAVLNPSSSTSSPPDVYAATQASLARVGTVATMTIAAAHVPGRTAGGLLAASTVSSSPTTDLLSFSVTDPDPGVAEKLATTYAREFTLYRRRLDTSALTAAIAHVRDRLARLDAVGLGRAPLARQLTATEHDLVAMQALQEAGTGAILVGRAGGAALVSPRTTRNVALGLLAGAALGVAFAFLYDALDTRVRSATELRERLGLPLLGTIPKTDRAVPAVLVPALATPDSPTAEAYRILKTNLDILQLRHDVSSMVITSTTEGEGKSTTAANLAVTLARSSRHVILVDLDLRRPGIHELFGLPDKPGLTEVAAGSTRMTDALHSIDVHANSRAAQSGRLELLTAGAPPPDPGELLSSNFVAETLERFALECDVLLIDAPPLHAVGDAMTIATRVDAVILVAELNVVHRATIAETRRLLEGCPAVALGFVATGSKAAAQYGYLEPGRETHWVRNA